MSQFFTVTQVDMMTPEQAHAAEQNLLLAPVRCINCETYVPYGWVAFGTITCPKNIGATGVQYGHRVQNDVASHLANIAVNRVMGV